MYVSVGASWDQPMDQPGTGCESVRACVQTELEASSWPVPADWQSCLQQEPEPAVPSATSASARWGIPAPGSAAGGQVLPPTRDPKI